MQTRRRVGLTADGRQRGAALLFGLVMLVLMTLFAISAFNASNVNLRVVNNVQLRQEAVVAADAAVQKVVSDRNNFHAGVTIAPIPVDIDGRGTKIYSATITKTCLDYRVLPPPYTSGNQNCAVSGRITGGGVASAGGGSATGLCSTINWDVGSVVNDTGTTGNNAAAEVHQGVSTTSATSDAFAQC